MLEISMAIKVVNQDFYIYSGRNYEAQLMGNSGVIGIPTNNLFSPIKLQMTLDVPEEGTEQSFYAYNPYDYPFYAKNILVTARKLQE